MGFCALPLRLLMLLMYGVSGIRNGTRYRLVAAACLLLRT